MWILLSFGPTRQRPFDDPISLIDYDLLQRIEPYSALPADLIGVFYQEANGCLAPEERNVLVNEYVELYISLRWSEEPY